MCMPAQLLYTWCACSSTDEIVLDLASYLHGLPHSIEAFFFTNWASDAQKDYVRGAWSRFAAQYRRTSVAPLLVYNPQAHAVDGPFVLAT